MHYHFCRENFREIFPLKMVSMIYIDFVNHVCNTKFVIRIIDLKIEYVCCSGFKEFLECSHHTVRRQCGDDTARFAKDFLDRMSSSLLRVNICHFCFGRICCHRNEVYVPSCSRSAMSKLLKIYIYWLKVVRNTTAYRWKKIPPFLYKNKIDKNCKFFDFFFFFCFELSVLFYIYSCMYNLSCTKRMFFSNSYLCNQIKDI